MAIKSRIRGGYQEKQGGRVPPRTVPDYVPNSGAGNVYSNPFPAGSVGTTSIDRNKSYLADNYGYDPIEDRMPAPRRKVPRFPLHQD